MVDVFKGIPNLNRLVSQSYCIASVFVGEIVLVKVQQLSHSFHAHFVLVFFEFEFMFQMTFHEFQLANAAALCRLLMIDLARNALSFTSTKARFQMVTPNDLAVAEEIMQITNKKVKVFIGCIFRS